MNEIIRRKNEHIINGRKFIMINLDKKVIEQCNDYLLELSYFLDKVYDVVVKNENIEVTKTYIADFGDQLDSLVKFIRKNDCLNKQILSNETDLKFALQSFGEAFHEKDYELCSQILKYELKYILFKWQSKLKSI